MSDLGSPQLSWKDNMTPQSDRFGDVYFSVEDGVAESLYVFVEGCGLPEGFSHKERFCVAETGFGTGLNFLLTWKALKESHSTCRLDFVSVEAFPLDKEILKKAYKKFPELTPYVMELLDNYPALHPGFHHIVLDEGRVHLTLLFGDIVDMYSQFEGVVDAWYLDGFTPAKNPEMWSEKFFKQMARLSHSDTVLSTFTAAGFVKRGLSDVGFEMSKRKGFGKKRECLQGKFKGFEIRRVNPWFSKPSGNQKSQKIAVIGAGIAGCTLAVRLQEEGHDVTLIDRNDTAGSEGSGNLLGLIKPRLLIDLNGGGLFNPASYLKAVSYYDQLDDIWVGKRGLFHMFEDDADKLRQKIIVEKKILPNEDMIIVSQTEASEILGIDAPRGGVWYPRSGCVEPSKLCKRLSEKVSCLFDKTVTAIERLDDKWIVRHHDEKIFSGDSIVLAMAGETSHLNTFFDLRLDGRRGQVSYATATQETSKLNHVVACNGYLLPAKNGTHVVGASFEHWPDLFDHGYKEIKESSHEKNKVKFNRFLPNTDVEITGGRASIRAMSPDHYPMVGPVFLGHDYKETYGRLKHGPRAERFPEATYVEGLYVMTGLGARGIQSAPLLADILCSYISNSPSPVERVIRESLHPARFYIRDIKKAKQ